MSETPPRETAESIARRGVPYSWLNDEDKYRAALNWFANEVEAALKARDERALRLIDEHQALDVCNDNCWTTIKKAIRGSKQ